MEMDVLSPNRMSLASLKMLAIFEVRLVDRASRLTTVAT